MLIFLNTSAGMGEEVFLDLNSTEIQKYDTGKLQYENKKSYEYFDTDIDPSLSNLIKIFKEEIMSQKNNSNNTDY